MLFYLNKRKHLHEKRVPLSQDRPLPSSPGPLYQNEVKCLALDMKMIVHSHATKTHFPKKGCELGFILKVRVFETRNWPIVLIHHLGRRDIRTTRLFPYNGHEVMQ